MKNDFDVLVDKIIGLDTFWKANYYMLSMKKQPHGGVAHINYPNYYFKYHPKQMIRLFMRDGNDIPYFLEKVTDEAFALYSSLNIDIEELLMFCFDNNSFWYVGMKILQPKTEYIEENKKCPLIFKVISSKLSFEKYFDINEKKAIYALVCFLLDGDMVEIRDLKDIEVREDLSFTHNKYGLSLIKNAKFMRQGFIYDSKYYLYNIFFDTSIGLPMDEIPFTIKVINDEIPNCKFAMRLDENLATMPDKMISTASTDFQVYRGILLDFADIDKLISNKEVIVHFCPETFHKIVMIIKPDIEDGERFYHIEVEELWNKDIIKDKIVLTNFIHAKYYPNVKSFKHIDFSVNQYSMEIYALKYADIVNITGVPIDKYCTTHYKVWCVEDETISISTWSKLVSLTLDEPFRKLFFDMFTE
ncbi:hypothetical protein [Candidatus Clostridium helianthi]|uniref:Uncharacterized protein n=1 Tax=Candidatus Clostridium helianthi TaxID=3381660 RepID=A0ABW8RZB2_9CLOT